MADMFDYLNWRGDILFSQVGLTDADALVLSTLAYVFYDDVVPTEPHSFLTLREAAANLLRKPDLEDRSRVSADISLLQAAALTERFGRVGLTFYRNIFIPEEDTQFAAMTFLLEDGSAFLAFRGTDNSLVGWKEDFNMSFRTSIPAQHLAREYAEEFALASHYPLYLGGHSKGGNLAVYAAAKGHAVLGGRIRKVYNLDGPGFHEAMMEDPGYLATVPQIRTIVPQASVFGLLMEHREPLAIIRSSQIGIMQHDPYSWEILGKGFLEVEEFTPDSQFLDKTIRAWLADMTREERSEFFDTLFDLLMQEGATRVRDIFRPQNILASFKAMQEDGSILTTLSAQLGKLAEAAKTVQGQDTQQLDEA